MAKLEKHLNGNFSETLRRLTDGILDSSVSASLEEQSDFSVGDCRCSVRVFERYSWLGSNRVSLSLTLFGKDGDCYLSAVTSGGSQAVFFKMNTFGEEAFLKKLEALL